MSRGNAVAILSALATTCLWGCPSSSGGDIPADGPGITTNPATNGSESEGDGTPSDPNETSGNGPDTGSITSGPTPDGTDTSGPTPDGTDTRGADTGVADTGSTDDGETDSGSSDSSSSDTDPPPGCGEPLSPPATYAYGDDVPPSQDPPGGLMVDEVPMFVVLSWDDNAYSGIPGSGGDGGMTWANSLADTRTNPAGEGNPATYDGTPIHMSYYMTSTYIETWHSESPTYNKQAWRQAYDQGDEIGNHTHTHPHGQESNEMAWALEIENCNDWLTAPFDPAEAIGVPNPSAGVGVPAVEVYGFRAPYLEYNDAALDVLTQNDFWYDTSIEEGFQPAQDGTNFFWPYTLDGGSPGHDLLVSWGLNDPITPKPGLWELPLYTVIVPPDDLAVQYGFEPGLRDRLADLHAWWDPTSAKITGFDYNLWVLFDMNRDEFLATLQYSYDLHLDGNRAPFIFGAHTDYYNSKYTGAQSSTHTERQEAIEEFLDYVLLNSETRVVSSKQFLDWMRDPHPMACD
ncbi:MAG: polysaccharide deacetylase family protein [Myxococcota bacterium]